MVHIIRVKFEGSYGEIVPQPHYERKDSQLAKYCHTPESLFPDSLMVVIISSTYWSSDYKMFTKPYYEPKDDQYLKNCHTPFNHRLRLTLLLLSCKRTYRL